jgi:hypothetical protein
MTMKASDFLKQAAEVIEQRGTLRDKPDGERSMERAVEAYIALNGPTLNSETQGWVFMCILKLARATAGKPHLDDAVDLSGYAALLAECIERETEEGNATYTITPAGEAFLKEWAESSTKIASSSCAEGAEGDGWIPWSGGENPAPGKDVRYKLRDGSHGRDPSRHVDWFVADGYLAEWDIVAYKVIND